MEIVKMKVEAQGFDVPARGSAGAGAFDLRAGECVYLAPGKTAPVKTYLKMEMPEGMCALIIPRSGLGSKGIVLSNTVGLIDSDYRGEVVVHLRNIGNDRVKIEEGDRVAQMFFFRPIIPVLERVEELSDTARGAGGFGSTGVK